MAFAMHGELLGTHTTPQTVVTTGQPAMWAMPGSIGIVPGGHVPVHGCAGGGRGGGDGMKPPTCSCCWFWVCGNCGGGNDGGAVGGWVGGVNNVVGGNGGVVCIC